MTTLSSRDILTDDLHRAQQAGDFAAQAEALMALADFTEDEMRDGSEEQLFGMVPALYMQACTAYQQAGDTQGMVTAALSMINMPDLIEPDPRYANVGPNELLEICGVALAICLEVGNLWALASIYNDMSKLVSHRETRIALKNKALHCYESLSALSEQASTLEELRWSYPPTSLEHRRFLERAHELYAQLNDPKGLARTQRYLQQPVSGSLPDGFNLLNLFPEILSAIRNLGNPPEWNADD